jgi:hypothetical protein
MPDLPPMSARARHIRATLGQGTSVSADHPDIPPLRTDYAVERLVQHVEQVLERTPTPTSEQLDRIARLLKAGAK